jgi:predicted nucleic acid-binding protein
VEEPASALVDQFMAGVEEAICVSEFAASEVASGLSTLLRTQALDANTVHARLVDFDAWRAAETVLIDVESADLRSAGFIVRRFELMLRTADALHIAICRRLNASLVTLDLRLATAARALGLQVLIP